jgi:hypothetical protein
MKQRVIDISTDTGWHAFTTMRNNLVLAGKRPRGQILPDKRNLSQNALSFAVYGQIASQSEDQTVREIRAECKLNYGVPILRAEDEGFNEHCALVIDPLTYEQQLKAMEWTDVTSKMSVKPFSRYMDEVIRVYSQQGYCLLHPSEAA